MVYDRPKHEFTPRDVARVAAHAREPRTITEAAAALAALEGALLRLIAVYAHLLGFFGAFAPVYHLLMDLIDGIWGILQDSAQIPESIDKPTSGGAH